jgi:5-methylcytosine-specific restriction protein A
LGIWLACDVIGKSRYWNAFGTRNPKQNKMVPIGCEINFPLFGIDRRVSGGVAEDETGRLSLVHRGRIGGGRKGIGP